MDNFNSSINGGYNKNEVNAFVDYVIKQTQENISTIKNQKDEIDRLRKENDNLKSNNSYDKLDQRKVSLAEKEAELIITSAKDNASRIINDALIKSEKINAEKELFNKNVTLYKKKIKNALMEQLELLDDVEIL